MDNIFLGYYFIMTKLISLGNNQAQVQYKHKIIKLSDVAEVEELLEPFLYPVA